MAVRIWIPRAPLSDFVELLWFADGGAQQHTLERVLPTGTTELVINLLEDPLRVYDRENPARWRTMGRAVVTGAHSKFFVIDTAGQASLMGVHFKPGGAFPFFHAPADELRNAHVPLETLWHEPATELREQLLEAPTLLARFGVLERFLLARTVRPLERRAAVRFALQEFDTVPQTRTMSEVGRQIGLSQRRFIQVFSEEVGLTPKQYCRVRRFQEALRFVESSKEVDWTGIASACGYFDQAHFIHDFHAFSGLNPTAYLAGRGDHLNHVPIRD
jgi:AraC-like DNA-binding protein